MATVRAVVRAILCVLTLIIGVPMIVLTSYFPIRIGSLPLAFVVLKRVVWMLLFILGVRVQGSEVFAKGKTFIRIQESKRAFHRLMNGSMQAHPTPKQ